jgi:hypothetical protein
MKILVSILLLSTFLVSCEYEDDFQFMSDARGNLFSEEVYLNNDLCRDMSNTTGACTLQIPSTAPLKYLIAARPYSYRLTLVCSKKISFELTRQVKEMEVLEFAIPNSNFENETSFTCIGEIFPEDRIQAVSAKFETRIKVFNPNLIRLDKPSVRSENNKKYIVLGKYSLHARICDLEECVYTHKEVYKEVNLKTPLFVRNESASHRINYADFN